jgi:hypothetical protein
VDPDGLKPARAGAGAGHPLALGLIAALALAIVAYGVYGAAFRSARYPVAGCIPRWNADAHAMHMAASLGASENPAQMSRSGDACLLHLVDRARHDRLRCQLAPDGDWVDARDLYCSTLPLPKVPSVPTSNHAAPDFEYDVTVFPPVVPNVRVDRNGRLRLVR